MEDLFLSNEDLFNGRKPYDNPRQESGRTKAYWQWMNENIDKIRLWSDVNDDTYMIDEVPNLILERLNDVGNADYEASYLHHSIGHSWNKYSKIGNIYSLRQISEGVKVPVATILAKDAVVIHAREAYNASFSAKNMAALHAFANVMGWSVPVESQAFGTFQGGGYNTEMSYCGRDQDNNKTPFRSVFNGRVAAATLEAALKRAEVYGNRFPPSLVGLENTGFESLEIIYISGSWAKPDQSINILQFFAGYAQPGPLSQSRVLADPRQTP